MTTKTIFWGQDGDETLHHTDPDEAIEEIIDGYHPEPIAEIGEVTVYEYAPMTPSVPGSLSPLDMILEAIDEEYGNPEGDNAEPTPAMKDAEKAFIAAVIAEYRSWMCEQTGKSVTVNALEWSKEHRPDWLKESAAK